MSLNKKIYSHFEINSGSDIKIDDFVLDLLKNTIKSDKRVAHSISVANLAYKIALGNNLNDPFYYYLAGLFHDIAKGIDKKEAVKLMNLYYKEYLDLPAFSYHQFLGEYLTKKLIGIEDNAILDAIKFHCTGKANMTSLDKIIYASDKIDPLRGYDSSDMINSMLENHEKGFLYVLDENHKFLINKTNDLNSVNNRLSRECFEYYLKK